MGIISRLAGQTKRKPERQERRNAIEDAIRCAIEPLESRLMLSTTNAWKSATSGDFDNPAMWSLGHVPTATEDAVINVAGNYTVSHSSGTDSVNSLSASAVST